MLFFKDVPIVVDPGVAALEVGIINVAKRGKRLFYVVFERVILNSETADALPFVVTSQTPHVFSMLPELDKSPFLLVYDLFGRLSIVYTREEGTNAWVRNDAAPEQVGETITQFSARFSFNTVRERDKFLAAMGRISNNKYSRGDVDTVSRLLNASVGGPVVLPIAIAPPQKSIA